MQGCHYFQEILSVLFLMFFLVVRFLVFVLMLVFMFSVLTLVFCITAILLFVFHATVIQLLRSRCRAFFLYDSLAKTYAAYCKAQRQEKHYFFHYFKLNIFLTILPE